VFSQIFIRRPILATVCSLLVMMAGVVVIPGLPIARFPELAPPSVTVTAIYTGANAQDVESAVTTPLEQAINGVQGLRYMTSSSTNSGFSTITVVFEMGRDQDLAAVEVQNRVNQALARMPVEVRNNGITVTKNTAGFLGGIGVYADDDRYDSLFLSNYIDLYIRDSLQRIEGVGSLFLFGERKYAMRVWIDPETLAGYGLTAGDVVAALREQNDQVAAGAVGQPPADAHQPYEVSVRAEGRLSDVTEFERVVVRAGRDGALVRVGDVGGSSSAPRPTRPTSGSVGGSRSASASSSCRRPTRSTCTSR
jgi:HAE1 family hydrophobic/amphiphilic exporter-1